MSLGGLGIAIARHVDEAEQGRCALGHVGRAGDIEGSSIPACGPVCWTYARRLLRPHSTLMSEDLPTLEGARQRPAPVRWGAGRCLSCGADSRKLIGPGEDAPGVLDALPPVRLPLASLRLHRRRLAPAPDAGGTAITVGEW